MKKKKIICDVEDALTRLEELIAARLKGAQVPIVAEAGRTYRLVPAQGRRANG